MSSVIIVEKNGTVRRVSISSKTLNVSELCKKSGFKTADGFNCAHTWTIELNSVEYKLQVFGKTKGKAGSENKYEFPPPIENVLFFGNCAVVNIVKDEITDMSTNDFNDIMDYLQGGYSDIDNSDEDEDDEFEDETDLPKTKEGYVKDDFIVDNEDDDASSSSEEPVKKKPKPVKKADKVSKPAKAEKVQIIKKKPAKPEPVVQPVTIFQCSDELVEEEYV